QRTGFGSILLSRESGSRGGGSVVRAPRARCGRVDEHRVELSPRASQASTTIALRNHRRRRSAKRGPFGSGCVVLLPRVGLSANQGTVRTWRQDGPGSDDDDRYYRYAARRRFSVALSLQQTDRRGAAEEHRNGGNARMERSRSDAGEGFAKRDWSKSRRHENKGQ